MGNLPRVRFVGPCVLLEEAKSRILVIGDIHLGMEAGLIRSGVHVPIDLLSLLTEPLDRVFEITGNVSSVILLGDIQHDFGIFGSEERKLFKRFTQYLQNRSDEIIITRGNHDTFLTKILEKESSIQIVDYYIWKRCCFFHGDTYIPAAVRPEIDRLFLGHYHPAVFIMDEIRQEKYKCFFVGNELGKIVTILPSLGELSIGSDPRYETIISEWKFNLDLFQVLVVGAPDPLDFGPLKTIALS